MRNQKLRKTEFVFFSTVASLECIYSKEYRILNKQLKTYIFREETNIEL